jgi:hypothetical protein
MMTERQLDPGHRRVQSVLCTLGPILIVLALAFIVLGIGGIFLVGPVSIVLAFLGMTLMFVGSVMTMFGFIGRVARYEAGEVAPVARDTFNYMAEGTQEGVRAVAGAIGQGLRAREDRAVSRRSGSVVTSVMPCWRRRRSSAVSAARPLARRSLVLSAAS